MMKALINHQSKTITGAALVLGAASFISRIIGFLRDRLFAHQFGAGETLDIYYAAFRIPDFIYNVLIAGALSAGFIPIFMNIWMKDSNRAWKLTNNIIHILLITVATICAILYLGMPFITRFTVPGFSAEAITQTIAISRIMLLSPIILGVSGVVSSVLQARKSFFIYSLTPIFYNLGIIIAAAFFAPTYGITALAYGVLAGALMHLLIQLPTLFQQGFRYTPVCTLQDPETKAIGKLMIPRTITLGINQLNILITTIIASTLAVGSITVFHFANNLQYFAVGIVGISFALAAFPTLAEAIAEKNTERFIHELMSSVKQILFLIIPLSLIFLLLRAQIVRVLLGSGAFDWQATIATANTLAFFTLSLAAQAVIPLLVRAFYAFHNTKTPLLISFIGMLFNIIGCLVFKDIFGVAGLALAFSLSSVFQLITLWWFLRVHTHGLQEGIHLRSVYKMLIAAMAMALAIQFIKPVIANMVNMERFWGIAIQGSISALVGILMYVAASYILKIDEYITFQKSFHRRWLKVWKVEPQLNEADEL